MSISAQFLSQKISAHFQFHLLNLRAINQNILGLIRITTMYKEKQLIVPLYNSNSQTTFRILYSSMEVVS